jgi:RNA polymerase sigma factor (sigma-70 family)
MYTENNKKLRIHQQRFIEKLICENEQAVAGMLFKMTDDRMLVEDVMIATWTTACQKVDMLAKHENPQGWLMKAAKFHMLRALEKYQRINRHEMQVLDKLELHMKNESQKELELSEMLKIYLTEEERTAVMLRYFYDVPYTELAEYFHMSESAARQKVSRAIKKLRKVAPDVWYR